jgi:hypothetical protein
MPKSQFNGIRKTPSKGIQYVHAIALKSPETYENENNEIVREVVYVTKAGRCFKKACSTPVFQRVYGKRMKRKPHTRLYGRLYDSFIIGIDKESDTVVLLDAYPTQLYGTGAQSAPEFRKKQEKILAVFNEPNGDITFEEIPPGYVKGDAAMMKLTKALHEAATIAPGNTFEKDFEVTAISGNRVFIDLLAESE